MSEPIQGQFLHPTSKFIPPGELKKLSENAHRIGLAITLVTGVFDVLHLGHVRLLQAAQSASEICIVGLNTDTTVRALKGNGRPVNPLADRAEMLLALRTDFYITSFQERTPGKLIKLLRPAVFVKGPDYRGKTLPEQSAIDAVGCELRIFEGPKDRSSSEIIERTGLG